MEVPGTSSGRDSLAMLSLPGVIVDTIRPLPASDPDCTGVGGLRRYKTKLPCWFPCMHSSTVNGADLQLGTDAPDDWLSPRRLKPDVAVKIIGVYSLRIDFSYISPRYEKSRGVKSHLALRYVTFREVILGSTQDDVNGE
ncbi:hypothetical protein EVAR_34431_1 [Eumeta japonica]|uniref:Uncharacterized protein n=1 Tax=Eumeta variegata TaxID=151549 RepID=A0A4C1WN51_EUMVA|nr:hypothetical protein EVAR_34431_1 [Eumeta japonica]